MMPPGLSMLWESVDPREALAERFGFARLEAATDWLATVLATEWELELTGCERVRISWMNAIAWVRAGGRRLVVKWSQDQAMFPRLAASTEVTGRLARAGVPVAAPIVTRGGRYRIVADGPAGPLSVAVLPEVVDTGFLDTTDDRAVFAAGAALAEVHRALAGYRDDRLMPADPPEGDLRRRITDWLANDDAGYAPEASRRLAGLLGGLPPLGGVPQFTHGDFRAANLLTRDSRIVAVLDFDDLRWDHRLVDLAKASVFLGTVFTDWQPTAPEVRRTFHAGYASVGPLTDAERRWLDPLVLWWALAAIPAVPAPAAWTAAV